MECLSRRGFVAEAFTGSILESNSDVNPAEFLAGEGLAIEASGRPDAYLIHEAGVRVEIHKCRLNQLHAFEDEERLAFLAHFEVALDRSRPDIIVTYGGDLLSLQIRSIARSRGCFVVFALHNFSYMNRAAFDVVDSIFVPSRFAAAYYRHKLGLECHCLPNLIDFDRARATDRDPRYVTFVNPSHEKGVFIFARIADELGRRRPDIPLLVVESRGTEQTLVDCGLDLRASGNVSVMAHTPDPRHFWGVTKVCLMPSLWWENQPLVAIEAMINGIPVIGSDRGGITEALGESGIVLGLPQRLTRTTRELPTAEEVKTWIKAIIALWDDPAAYQVHRERALREAERWKPERLEILCSDFFSGIKPGGRVLTESEKVRPTVPIPVESPISRRPNRPDDEPMLECCIVFTHYRDDDTTRYHLDLLRRLNPFPVVAVCNASPERVEGAVDVDLLSRRWSDEDKWSSADSILYRWFLHGGIRARRYLMLEWDTLATMPVKEFYGELWDRDAVATSVKRIETHPEWQWFRQQLHLLPPHLRQHAAGVVPFNGLLLSHRALAAVVEADPPPGIFCELRIGTLLRASGFDLSELPPEKRKMNSFHPLNISFDGVTPGIYHPIKQRGIPGPPQAERRVDSLNIEFSSEWPGEPRPSGQNPG